MSKKMVTLNELLEIKDFAERVTLVNKHGNLNNQITHVTIMEGPDLHEWVTGGEFVLTTWYAFSKVLICRKMVLKSLLREYQR